MSTPYVNSLIESQRAFFATGVTKDVNFRIEQLKKLRRALVAYEDKILEAVRLDMNKPPLEAYSSEIGMPLVEVNVALRNLRKWARPRRVMPHLTQLPSSAWIIPEPYGVTLVIAPWNYPVTLVLMPMISAISAGNCVVLKPSEISQTSSFVLAEMIRETFDGGFVCIAEGGPDVGQALLEAHWDKILYTGGERVGKLVMKAAAEYLTPVTLELGGKSPTIVDDTADVELAAKRIVWGKFWNAGQTCIAPDYVLADKRIKPGLMEAMKRHIAHFYGDDARQSQHYGPIINRKHFERVRALLREGEIVLGGQTDERDFFISPTLIDNPPLDGPLMTEEIFGPVLPVIETDDLDDAIRFVVARPKPLSLYLFSRSKANQNRVLRNCSYGGGCINDTVTHFAQSAMPFGGVGSSGHGDYRGEFGFRAFSNFKGILKKSSLASDALVRYPPHTALKRTLVKMFMR